MSHSDLTITWLSSTSPPVGITCHLTLNSDQTAVIVATSSATLGVTDKSILANSLWTLLITLQDMSQRNSLLGMIPNSWVDFPSSDGCPLSLELAQTSFLKSPPRSWSTISKKLSRMFQPPYSTARANSLWGDTSGANSGNKLDGLQMPRKARSTKSKRICVLCAKLRSIIRALSKKK